MLLLFVVGQSFLVGDFLRYGRSQHTEAFEYIASLSDGDSITLGGNEDALSKILIDFYESARPDGGTLDYVEGYETATVSPEWLFMVQSECPGAKPMDFCNLLGQDRRNFAAEPELRRQVPESDKIVVYKLDRESLHWGLSGWDLSLYRKARDPP